jgi:hypothetical protein
VPDPFLAYAKGENVLRQQLAEVPSSLLRAMIIAYGFADPSDRDLHALTHVELIELMSARSVHGSPPDLLEVSRSYRRVGLRSSLLAASFVASARPTS